MANSYITPVTIFIILAAPLAMGYDPSALQDFCVAAAANNGVFVNGKVCLNPNDVTADHFFFRGVANSGNTANKVGSNVTLVNVDRLPGLNTLGLSIARIDFAPRGLNPPHTHPRATEILVVLEGTLLVGFVTSNQQPPAKNRLFTRVLHPGDVFVFPIGLVHFQLNVGNTNALAFAALNSQNPGAITVANALFGSDPPINDEVLTKAFQVDVNIIRRLQQQFI